MGEFGDVYVVFQYDSRLDKISLSNSLSSHPVAACGVSCMALLSES